MAHPVVLGLNDCEDGGRGFDLTKQRLLQRMRPMPTATRARRRCSC